ncbi:helix-turn-helix domain-containing protein [Halorussus marinus]|uniref:helix-turn-helix domain-containing protein n=1 Tax=Halorussus marinus TaxID=2505976 RepID=UPI00106EF7FD|nr:helix-turn-helix domain-containing protein [Halorussus marinus]
MHEALLGIDQPGAYADATAGTDTTVELWCNDHCDLLHVSGGADSDAGSPAGRGTRTDASATGADRDADAGATAVVAHVEATVGVRERLVEDGQRLLITDDCLKSSDDDHIESVLADHGCLLVPPLTYADGTKWCRVLALDPANLTGFYRAVAADHPVTVESKREVASVAADRPLLTFQSALPDLSARQREALATATEFGYYRIPRDTTTADLAAEMGVERRTFEEHLRRAENKLLGAMVEYL